MMGNHEFVNTHDANGVSAMLYAAQEGHSGAILSMVMCNGNPARQGSNWVDFFMAATSTFRLDMARAIYIMLNIQSLLPVGLMLSSVRSAAEALS